MFFFILMMHAHTRSFCAGVMLHEKMSKKKDVLTDAGDHDASKHLEVVNLPPSSEILKLLRADSLWLSWNPTWLATCFKQ